MLKVNIFIFEGIFNFTYLKFNARSKGRLDLDKLSSFALSFYSHILYFWRIIFRPFKQAKENIGEINHLHPGVLIGYPDLVPDSWLALLIRLGGMNENLCTVPDEIHEIFCTVTTSNLESPNIHSSTLTMWTIVIRFFWKNINLQNLHAMN